MISEIANNLLLVDSIHPLFKSVKFPPKNKTKHLKVRVFPSLQPLHAQMIRNLEVGREGMDF